MIARLVGTLVAREGHRAVLDVHGVGYAVHAPLRDVEAWAQAGEPVVAHVHTDVREDAIVLYGFSRDRDRVAFERLRAVGGVGPKIALALLDALGLERLVQAVARDEIAVLAQAPGVGKKLASRLALELKDKLPGDFSSAVATAGIGAAPAADPLDLALAKLGYGRSEIGRAREGLAAEGLGPEAPIADRLRAALRILSGR
ncbi:MAG: Holliday junction branch migration protein RuvA [Alphaproteobacteria bacterium]|nr:Holliday junction branch migration protein RuvA [Alphaproteobacteria bacterium]